MGHGGNDPTYKGCNSPSFVGGKAAGGTLGGQASGGTLAFGGCPE